MTVHGYAGVFVCMCAGACLHIQAASINFIQILIQLAVGLYKIALSKYLHYSMLIASLMAGAECSIVVR